MVRVLFFGATADLAGKREVAVLTEDTTVGSILERLLVDHPALAKVDLQFAVNQQFASRDTVVPWFAELAIFTAVSGG